MSLKLTVKINEKYLKYSVILSYTETNCLNIRVPFLPGKIMLGALMESQILTSNSAIITVDLILQYEIKYNNLTKECLFSLKLCQTVYNTKT